MWILLFTHDLWYSTRAYITAMADWALKISYLSIYNIQRYRTFYFNTRIFFEYLYYLINKWQAEKYSSFPGSYTYTIKKKSSYMLGASVSPSHPRPPLPNTHTPTPTPQKDTNKNCTSYTKKKKKKKASPSNQKTVQNNIWPVAVRVALALWTSLLILDLQSRAYNKVPAWLPFCSPTGRETREKKGRLVAGAV